MKKIIYSLLALTLGFASCERSLEETYEEIGAPEDTFGLAENDYTITEEDYETLLADDEGDFVEYFSTIEEAEEFVPNILDEFYPGLDNGSLSNVTFNLLDNVFPETFISTAADYQEVFEDDSKEVLNGVDEIDELLKSEFSQAIVGDYVQLSYQSLGDIISYTLTDDDYEVIGASEDLAELYPTPISNLNQWGNFSRDENSDTFWSDEALLDALTYLLNENFPNAAVGQIYEVNYDAFRGDGNNTRNLKKISTNESDNYIICLLYTSDAADD